MGCEQSRKKYDKPNVPIESLPGPPSEGDHALTFYMAKDFQCLIRRKTEKNGKGEESDWLYFDKEQGGDTGGGDCTILWTWKKKQLFRNRIVTQATASSSAPEYWQKATIKKPKTSGHKIVDGSLVESIKCSIPNFDLPEGQNCCAPTYTLGEGSRYAMVYEGGSEVVNSGKGWRKKDGTWRCSFDGHPCGSISFAKGGNCAVDLMHVEDVNMSLVLMLLYLCAFQLAPPVFRRGDIY